MNNKQIKQARLLMGLTQTEFAAQLGWSTKRHIVSLERNDRQATVQTAIAIRCLLKEAGLFEDFEGLVKKEIRT